jgi:short chain dehydrogenase
MASKTKTSKVVIPTDSNPISAELQKINQYRSFAIYPYKTWRSIPSLSTAIYNISLSAGTVLTGTLSLAVSVAIVLPFGIIKTTLDPIVRLRRYIANRNKTGPPRRCCVVITGANSGIGAALALEYATSPNTHLVLIARDIPRLELVAEQAQTLAENITTEIHSIDFYDATNAAVSLRSILTNLDTKFGGIDVAIASAGVTGHRNGVLLPA